MSAMFWNFCVGIQMYSHYLPLDGMVNIQVYLSGLGMLGTTQLNSILFADHITLNNGYMERTHTRQEMTNNKNNNKRKQI